MRSPKKEPFVGELYTSSLPEMYGHALLVVISTQRELRTGELLVDALLASLDTELASELSLQVSAEDSGIGIALVLQIDTWVTLRADVSHEKVGRLPQSAGQDLMDALHAYHWGGPLPKKLRASRVGDLEIRRTPHWHAWADRWHTWLGKMYPPMEDFD